jgi:hypothetical protein
MIKSGGDLLRRSRARRGEWGEEGASKWGPHGGDQREKRRHGSAELSGKAVACEATWAGLG